MIPFQRQVRLCYVLYTYVIIHLVPYTVFIFYRPFDAGGVCDANLNKTCYYGEDTERESGCIVDDSEKPETDFGEPVLEATGSSIPYLSFFLAPNLPYSSAQDLSYSSAPDLFYSSVPDLYYPAPDLSPCTPSAKPSSW